MSDNDKIISFVDAKDRRIKTEIDSDQAQWADLNDRLFKIMMASDLQNHSLVSATINALLKTLQRSDMDIDEAKISVNNCVEAMF